MGKHEVKVITEKEKTKRVLVVERIFKEATKLAFIIMLGIVLVASLLIADWR